MRSNHLYAGGYPGSNHGSQGVCGQTRSTDSWEQAHRLINKVLGMVEEEQTQVEVQKAEAN